MSPRLSLRDKVAHAYRRLGFGGSIDDIQQGVQEGLDATLKRLIDYDAVKDGFDVSPYEFCWRPKNKNQQPDLGTYLFRSWWALRMMASKRPFQEKLTLFWHSNLAAGDDKVENGPMMLSYQNAIRKHASGKFLDLLTAVSQEPAMLKYLDLADSFKGRPNENYPREVMELFTLGIGNYTEADVKEVARAFTGWGYEDFYYQLPGDDYERLRDAIRFDRPFSSYVYMPAMHDGGVKSILGKTGRWTGADVLAILAKHSATAHHISTKLWEFFAYPNPESHVVEAMAHRFERTGGDIRQVIWTMVKLPEFWSERCVRTMPKSPSDYVIGLCRQMNAGNWLLGTRSPNSTPYDSIAPVIANNSNYAAYTIERQGLILLQPPNVSGWKWGAHWIAPDTMLMRIQFRGLLIYGPGHPGPGAAYVVSKIEEADPKNSRDIADAMCAVFDTDLPDDARNLVARQLDKVGGVKNLANPKAQGYIIDSALHVMISAPEFHIC